MPTKNLMGRTRATDQPPYLKFVSGDWTWNVLKSYQTDSSKQFARWFCDVFTPMCPMGEMGDTYASDVCEYGTLVDVALEVFPTRSAIVDAVASGVIPPCQIGWTSLFHNGVVDDVAVSA